MARTTIEQFIEINELYIRDLTEDIKNGVYDENGYQFKTPTKWRKSIEADVSHQISRLLYHREDQIYFIIQKILINHCIDFEEFDKYKP